MRRAASVVTIGLLVGLLSACADLTTTGEPADGASSEPEASGHSADPLAGTAWTLSEADLGASVDAAELGVTAEFTEGTLAGRAPVNTYTTSYEVSDGELTLGPIASTRMAGPPEAMDAEQAYFTLLASVTGFAVVGDELSLLADEEEVLSYTAASSTAEPGATGEPGAEEAAATEEFAATLVGMSVDEAEAAAEAADLQFRVVSIDGQPQAATSDLRYDRINASIEDDVVVEVSVG